MGICGRRGSRDLPEAVRPVFGWREVWLFVEVDKRPLGIMMLSPERPWDISVVSEGASSMWRSLGALDIIMAAPRVDVLGL